MIESPAEPNVLAPAAEAVAFPARSRWERPFRWLLGHPALLAAGLANLVFVFLPFYDANNIPLALSVGAHLTNGYAPATYNGWVAGPFIYAVFVPMHLAYVASGYQLYAAYTVLKAIYFGLTLWLAYSIYRVFRLRTESLAIAVATFVLANPMLLYVSYIWTEYDILPIAFVTAGYLLLRFTGRELSEPTRILSAVALIAVSVFFYWFALVLVPTLLYYTRTRRELALELAGFAGVFGSLFLATFVAFGDTPTLFTGALSGSNSALNRADSFGFQFFLPLTGTDYLLLVGGLALVLPLVLRALRFTEPATLAIVLTLFVFTSAVPMPDNYVFVFPFALLSFLFWPPARTRLRWLWGLLAYPLVGLFLINFLIANAQPDGVGIFMFGYSILGQNVRFLHGVAQQTTFLWGFNFAVVCAIVLSLGLLAIWSRTEPARTFLPPPDRSPPSERPRFSLAGRRRSAFAGGVTLATFVGFSLLFNAVVPNLVDYRGTTSPPVYEMLPNYTPQNGNVVRSLPGVTYSVIGNSLEIASASPPFSFDRWFAGNNLQLAGRLSLQGVTPRSTLVLDGLPYRLWLDNNSAPALTGASTLTPAASTGVRSGSNASLPGNESVPSGLYDSHSYSVYSFAPGRFDGRYYLFSFYPGQSVSDQTAVFFVDGPHEYVTLVYNANQTSVAYSGWLTGNRTESIVLGGIVPLDQWSYAIVDSNSAGVQVDINGFYCRVALPLFATGPTSLFIGTPAYNDSLNNSFHGYATGLYAMNTTPQIVPAYGFTLQDGDQFTNQSLGVPQVTLRIASSAGGTAYSVDNLTLHSAAPTTAVAFGKYSAAPYTITFTLDQFTVTQYAPDRYYLVPVFWATVGPFALFALTLPLLRRGVGPPQSHPGPSTAPTDPRPRG